MVEAGHNNPPSEIEAAKETQDALGRFLEDHPVIQTEEEAREGKLYIDRARGSLDEMEAERDKLVRPLNEQVKKINNTYRAPRETLSQIRDHLLARLDAYRKEEQAKRGREADEKRHLAEIAEERARASAILEQQAKSEASHGVIVDVAATTITADQHASRLQSALREAARAEKAVKDAGKITGGFGRALTPKKTEVLTLVDWYEAISEMGLSESLIETILKEARAYRRASGNLPAGINQTFEEGFQ